MATKNHRNALGNSTIRRIAKDVIGNDTNFGVLACQIVRGEMSTYLNRLFRRATGISKRKGNTIVSEKDIRDAVALEYSVINEETIK